MPLLSAKLPDLGAFLNPGLSKSSFGFMFCFSMAFRPRYANAETQ
ncbi:hypothetical protein [Moorena sp. SIO1F2]|nr:hypothetical protein [Moorena sp. SIO1F2]